MILKDTITGQPVQAVIVLSPTLAKDISVPCVKYLEHQERLDLVNTLMGGTKAMMEAGQTYLPKEPEESTVNYENRLQRTVLFNAFKRTIKYLSGQVFSKAIVLKEDVPEEIRGSKNKTGFMDNIDLKGNNIDVFSKEVFEAGIRDGTTTILVDYPPVDSSRVKTKEEQRGIGARPYWVHIPVTSIIGWKTGKTKDGQEYFRQLRIKEVVELDDPDNPYHTIPHSRIRLLEADPDSGEKATWAIYQYDTKQKKWVLIDGPKEFSMKFIPLAVFQPGERLSPLTAVPPLEDLAYLNLSHWQSSSDQLNILHFTRLPILFGKNIDDNPTKIEVGPNRMIHSRKPDSDLKYVEHTGRAIGAGQAQLTDLETKMAMWGLQLLMPKSGNITATEKALSSGESDSTLKSWVVEFKDFLETCLKFTVEYEGEENGGSVYVNTEFRWMQTLDAEVLLKAWQLKLLPRRVVFDELQRRGIIGDDVDFVELLAQVEEEQRQDMLGLGGPDVASAAQKYLSVSTAPPKSMSAVGSPYSVKRGSGKKGGV